MAEIQFAVEELTEDLLAEFKDFCCGEAPYHVDLDEFLRDDALKQSTDRLNKTFLCFAAYDNEGPHPVGYFALSAAHIDKDEVPPGSGRRRLPYRIVPALLVGRFAVDRNHHRKGHGGRMMAKIRTIARELTIGCRFLALHVEADNEEAIKFYLKEEFIFAQGIDPVDGQRLMLYDLLKS
jgi:GNAT superfamily N-acetyltransferase